jgi:hypothetical protein
VVVKIKTYPAEDGGLIGPIKSKPHFKKEKSGRKSCKGMDRKTFFPSEFLALVTRS